MTRLGLGVALSACVLMAFAARPAAAGAAGAAGIGVVDMDRVSGEFRGLQLLNQQFLDFQKEQETQLQRRQNSRLLSDEEQREYLDLAAPTAAPTPERDTRLAALEKLSDERSRRLLDLTQKASRTPEEDEEYQNLDRVYKRRSDELKALQEDATKVVVAKHEQLTKIINDSLNAAVQMVAAEKGLGLILRKEIVLFGGADVTEDVITKLNKEPVPQAGAGSPQPTAKPQG